MARDELSMLVEARDGGNQGRHGEELSLTEEREEQYEVNSRKMTSALTKWQRSREITPISLLSTQEKYTKEIENEVYHP